MREVPSELQGDLLEAMRDILKNLNDEDGISFGSCFPFYSYASHREEEEEATG